MTLPAPPPSSRLVRAAAAESVDLRRHREKLVARRETLRAELETIEASLDAVRDREALLNRLTQKEANGEEPSADAAINGGGEEPASVLRGPAIRRTAVAVLAADPKQRDSLHYREWFALLVAAGYAVQGKDPLAVFLTQLTRSPSVRKGTQQGVYELDRTAPRRLRHRLDQLHAELRSSVAPPDTLTDLANVRAQRARLHAQIGQVEKALDEATALVGVIGAAAHLSA
jgi:hypothetical protein